MCGVLCVLCLGVSATARPRDCAGLRDAREPREPRENRLSTRAYARTRVFVEACRAARERGARVRRGCEVRVGRSNTIRDF